MGGGSAVADAPPGDQRARLGRPPSREFEVESYLLLSRSRYEQSQLQILSCVRYDLLRRSGPGAFKLARREIIVDQSVLGMANLAVFL